MEFIDQTLIDPISGVEWRARQLVEADLDQVTELETRLFSPPWSRQAFMDELENETFSLAVVVSEVTRIIAYMIGYFIFEQVHLTNIAVAPEYQKRGIGEWLVRQLIQRSQDEHRQFIHLEVRRSNHNAIRLYTRLGFAAMGVRKRYYEDKEDAILMHLQVMP
jgi:[ribosomal protein S18]-alanine N-acetyltransferase